MTIEVKQKYVVDITDLDEEYDNLLSEISSYCWDSFGQNTYCNINMGWLERFYTYDDDGNEIPDEETINEYPTLYKFLKLMETGDLPEEFILLIWW